MPSDGDCKATISREQRDAEHLGQRYIGCIVGTEVVPQLPNPRQQHSVRISTDLEGGQFLECTTCSRCIEFTRQGIPANDLGNLDVDEVRRVKGLLWRKQMPRDCCRCRRLQQCVEHCRGVDDDHRRSRSARTASAGETEGLNGGSLSSRAFSSSTVGCSAIALMWSSK